MYLAHFRSPGTWAVTMRLNAEMCTRRREHTAYTRRSLRGGDEDSDEIVLLIISFWATLLSNDTIDEIETINSYLSERKGIYCENEKRTIHLSEEIGI